MDNSTRNGRKHLMSAYSGASCIYMFSFLIFTTILSSRYHYYLYSRDDETETLRD